jgi:hypothetical protein
MTSLPNGSLDGLDVWGRPDDVADDDSYFKRGRRHCLHCIAVAIPKRIIPASAMRTPRYPSLT